MRLRKKTLLTYRKRRGKGSLTLGRKEGSAKILPRAMAKATITPFRSPFVVSRQNAGTFCPGWCGSVD